MDPNDDYGPGRMSKTYVVYDASGEMLFAFLNKDQAYQFSSQMPKSYVRVWGL
jgi:hypothetical protein